MRDSQPERTRLAWRRTGLTVTVVALLAGRLALAWPLLVPAVVALWAVALVAVQRRVRAMSADPPPPPGRALTVVVISILGYAGLGALLTGL